MPDYASFIATKTSKQESEVINDMLESMVMSVPTDILSDIVTFYYIETSSVPSMT